MLEALIAMMVFGALFVMLPLMLIAGVLKLVLALVFLPFKILGGLFFLGIASIFPIVFTPMITSALQENQIGAAIGTIIGVLVWTVVWGGIGCLILFF